jgi:hypothetical protein
MNKFCGIFSQLLQLFPRYEFQNLVKNQTERQAKIVCIAAFKSRELIENS